MSVSPFETVFLLSTLPVRRPRPTEWVRARPEPQPAFACHGLYHRGVFYIVSGEAALNAINLHVPRRKFALVRNHVGELSLWPMSLHPSDAPDAWMQARETAEHHWTRLEWAWDEDGGPRARILTTGNNFYLPEWPTASLLQIVLDACAGRYICTPDHPVIARIKSDLHNAMVPNTAA